MHYWVLPKFEDLHALTKEHVLFGLFLKDETRDLTDNTIIILGMFFFYIVDLSEIICISQKTMSLFSIAYANEVKECLYSLSFNRTP